MSKKLLINTLRFFIVLIVQLFILNNVYITGYIVPVIYIYFILKLPFGTNKLLVLFLSFLTGILIDLFTGTYGIHAAATTLVGALRLWILNLFFEKVDDDNRNESPSVREFGLYRFAGYILLFAVIHTSVFLGIENFGLTSFFKIALRIITNSLFSAFLIVLIDILVEPARKRVK